MAEEQKDQNQVQMPELALRCAQFFMVLSESCLQYYHQYKDEKQRKTKFIKKNIKKPRAKPKTKTDNDNVDEEVSKKLPKKPLTAYIIYFQEKKPKFVEKHPGLNLSELTKLIAKEWKEINEDERKPYLDQAHEERKRYEKQLQQFRSKYGVIKDIEESNPEEILESFAEEGIKEEMMEEREEKGEEEEQGHEEGLSSKKEDEDDE